MSRILQVILVLVVPLGALATTIAMSGAWAAKAGAYDYVVRFDLPSVDAPVDLPRVDGPADASRPLVVIDPGHGGFDPGAGAGDLKEKAIALQIALMLRSKLLADGGIRVALTREADRFIALPDRPDIARRLNADLFVSIHADSAPGDTARGASVYILSENGSSQAAERFAARENAAGNVNGVSLADQRGQVGAILLDLSQRRTQARSGDMARLVLRQLAEAGLAAHKDEPEMAALAVLKAPDVPSVLLETGYINNVEDAKFLASAAGQRRIADAGAKAIRAYFARNPGG